MSVWTDGGGDSSRGIVGWVCALLRVAAGVAALGSVLAASGWADTIVLKNGKRIVALSVVEDGDKIRYETAAGQLSLPKSIVDHIERGPAGVMPDSPAANAAAAGDCAAGVRIGRGG